MMSFVIDTIKRQKLNRSLQKQNSARYNEFRGMSNTPSVYVFNAAVFLSKSSEEIKAKQDRIRSNFKKEKKIIFIKTFITMILLTFISYMIFLC